MLSRAIGNYLDGNKFSIADEVTKPSTLRFKTYQGLTDAEFLKPVTIHVSLVILCTALIRS
jgi:hypothetical protein